MLKTLSAACVVWAGLCAHAMQPPTARPNIVLIMTDDQGLGDLSITGNPHLETPSIDALARQGVSFSRFYVSPVCSPTRASLMTGRYSYRTRVVDTWVGRSMMDPGEVTIAEVLREAGYATGIFGKWHLGDCYPMRPQDQGFDEVLVHRGGGLAQPSEPPENDRRYTDAILFRNGEPVRTEGYCTDVFFDAALEFIDRSAERGRPFFAYIATNAPHDPYHDVPEALYEKYSAMDLSPQLNNPERYADDLARVFAMCENIDDNVGRLLARLDERSLADDTIVVYLHDNGPRIPHYAAGLRGRKTTPMEGGIRSPLYIRWPGVLGAGRVVDTHAAHYDLMPTLAELVGLDGSEVRALCTNPMDGRSLAPLLTGEPAQEAWPDRFLFFQAHRGDTPSPRHNFAVVGGRWKLVRSSGFNFEAAPDSSEIMLFDLLADPGERANLASEHPERFEAMLRAYDAWYADVSTTRPDNYDPPRIVIGTPHETTTTLTHQDSRRWFEGDFDQAVWKLRAEGNRTYTVRVLADSDHTRGTLTLGLNDDTHAAEVSPDSRWTVLRDIPIPAGPTDLWAAYDGTDVPTTAYHVVLELED
ncbi:MAG: arylsulfatase [Phycisphaerales bacterium JB040]